MATAMPNAPSMIDAAVWWAAQGFPIFPVFELREDGKCACGPTPDCIKADSAGKHPRIGKWQLLATTDAIQIREWWTRWPNANIGICCGQELDGGGFLLVVDVDPRHDGDMHLALLEQKYSELPHTARNVTGGGGQHIFLRSSRKVKSRSNALGPGVDVKCDRGYVLAPPSNHKSGGRYRRDAGFDIADTVIADAPNWLTILADPPEVTTRETSSKAADAFIEGGRHDAVVSLTGTLRRRGLSPAEMLPTLLAVNSARCRPPLDEHEVKKIAYSASWNATDPLHPSNDPWNIMTAEQIFAPLPPYPWLLPGLHLAPGRISLLNGDANVGKTVVAMSIALGVASGRPVWGVYRPEKRGPVLHLNGEIGSYIARERYQRLARGMGIPQAELETTLRLSNYPAARLDDPDFEAKLRLACEGHALVVVDSLRAFSGALDEKAKEIGIALLMLARVSDATGATILVLHHNRKPPADGAGRVVDSISGSTSILGSSECAFIMFREKEGPITVKHERSPVGKYLPDFGLQFEDVENNGDARWGLRVVHMEQQQIDGIKQRANAAKKASELSTTQKAIRATLEKHAGVFRGSKDAFRAACGVGKNPFLEGLAFMTSHGEVRQEGTYHQPEWHLVVTSIRMRTSPDSSGLGNHESG
jgi:KaiC/GvpD/RAD55 family RecA-like ATPase